MNLKISRKAVKLTILIIFGVLLAIYAVYLAVIYFNPRLIVNYKQFVPTYLPADVSLQKPQLRVLSNQLDITDSPTYIDINLDLWPINVDTNFYFLNDHIDRIGESKADNKDIEDNNCAYLQSAIYSDDECLERTTPGGQNYIHTIVKNEQDVVYEIISFLKDGTDIYFFLDDNSPLIGLSDQEWSKIIDSFVQTDVTDYSIVRYHPGRA